ncbi:MAG: phosphoenolpyruvate synthase [Proteobacteria bacterium]|nr:phosphoenolpyruvate synthase [Pseudomonadota bacterium]
MRAEPTADSPACPPEGDAIDDSLPGLVGERLSREAFHQLAGILAGISYVKVVVERRTTPARVHFINDRRYKFHSDYIAENVLGISVAELDNRIDAFNTENYQSDDRRFLLGTVALQKGAELFYTLETVEIDTMGRDLVIEFYRAVRASLDRDLPLLFKLANHMQEAIGRETDAKTLPRISAHELTASASFIALNPGEAEGRLRVFENEEAYRRERATLEWYDIIAMRRVPDDIPRLSGIINAEHTTPLSHTNVLASGWNVPNAVQLGFFEHAAAQQLSGSWVRYRVDADASAISLSRIEAPKGELRRPSWAVHHIQLEEPETVLSPIVELSSLRMSDRNRYGTKAANLGELYHVLEHGSDRLLGFYKVRRPPRPHLLGLLARYLGVPEPADARDTAALAKAAAEFLAASVKVPRGIALPFSIQQRFLESSPRIQQTIGRLKMALELGAREVEPLCVKLQELIRTTRLDDGLREEIDAQITQHLFGVSSFVIRSSSNAEDIEHFSAAGLYESIAHVSTADTLFQSIKEVWASVVSPRSVRLREEVGISLDAVYMGVIVQEQLEADIGGVLVTTNPANRAGDYRNVYINVSKRPDAVVDGSAMPLQYLYNTLEGGGRTLSLGDAERDLDDEAKDTLQRLAFAGRLLQGHYSPDYTFSVPVDIEWLVGPEGLTLLQLRPYSK